MDGCNGLAVGTWVAVEVGVLDGASGGEAVAEAVGWRLGLRVGEGAGAGRAFGVTRGAALPSPPCHDRATYPPAGTVSEPTPAEEYVQLPDLPSDHHSDQ